MPGHDVTNPPAVTPGPHPSHHSGPGYVENPKAPDFELDEPLGSVAARWLNLVVVPLVGIDAAGCRLGMGAGYYDRALAFRRVQRHRFGPHLVGLAFEVQRTQETFAEPWDIRLDSLATESGLHLIPDQEGAT